MRPPARLPTRSARSAAASRDPDRWRHQQPVVCAPTSFAHHRCTNRTKETARKLGWGGQELCRAGLKRKAHDLAKGVRLAFCCDYPCLPVADDLGGAGRSLGGDRADPWLVLPASADGPATACDTATASGTPPSSSPADVSTPWGSNVPSRLPISWRRTGSDSKRYGTCQSTRCCSNQIAARSCR